MLTGVRPMYSPSVQTGWSGVVSRRSVRHWRWYRDALAVWRARNREAAATIVSRVLRVDREGVQQAVVDRVAVGDPQARAHHPGVHDVDPRGLELGRLTVDLRAIRDVGRPARAGPC